MDDKLDKPDTEPTTYALRVDVCATDYFAFKALANQHHGLQAQILRKAVKWAIREMREKTCYRQTIVKTLEEGSEG